jgi:putative ATP-binding cassette transporter
MKLVAEHLPDAAIVSIAHRPELEAFHQRKLVFEHRPGGSRLISDQMLKTSPTLNGHIREPKRLPHEIERSLSGAPLRLR